MEFHHYQDINTYSQDVLPFLGREEAANNLIIGLLLSLQKKPLEMATANLFSMKKNEEVVLVAMRTAPERALLIYGELKSLKEAAFYLCLGLDKIGFKAHHVLGPDACIQPFLNVWNAYYGLEKESAFKLKVFRLDQLTTIHFSAGGFRVAQKEDIPLLAAWRQAFDIEAFSKQTSLEESLEGVKEKMANNDLYVWENHGVAVTMAARARPTRHGITVNYVYTPPEHRKKGYATSCVAKLSQLMLDSGYEFCSLFTDAANPTSNKIYQNMGYKWVADFSNVKLKRSL
jgi:GNAT superfamily N-acetyltransferase